MRTTRRLAILPLLALTGCPTPPRADGGDAASDAQSDGTDTVIGCMETASIHSFNPSVLYVPAGGSQPTQIRLAHDTICGLDLTVTVADSAVAQAPASVRIDRLHGSVEFTVAGMTAGHTRLHVQVAGSTDPTTSADLDVNVIATAPPACPVATPAVTGNLAAGVTLRGTAGSPLEFASVAVPAAATTTTAATAHIACAADQIPAGFDAVGPAVAFTPGLYHYPREIALTLPINPALVPSFFQLHVEVAYTGIYSRTARIVPMANVRFTPDGKALYFEAPRLGTYQAVIRQGIGTHHATRHFTWRALLGVSMGGIGGSMIGMRHTDLFDFLMPLGGPADWGWFSDTFARSHIGGFCTAAERAAGVMDCSMASNSRTPAPRDYATAPQNFEWFNTDVRTGQGGFDRQAYMNIYRDLTHMFGNPLMQSDPANGVLPLGVPATELTRSDADRCATPLTLQHYCDDEYNPDGSLPVITFCDGANTDAAPGVFDPTLTPTYPFDMGLAVDINANGHRDPGEPVIRNIYEPWHDVGTDGIASASETGYDAVTNPDPAGDDYDRQYNPAGTEGNYLRESGEPFDDLGLDGVANSASHGCTHDVGEGNGRFDVSTGVARFLELNGRAGYAALPHAQAHRVQLWTDGGMRDVFNFGASTANFVGAVAQQGENLHLYNNFASLQTGAMFNPGNDDGFVWSSVDWAHLPNYTALRYGFWDASPTVLAAGDGGHVGTAEQLLNRSQSAVAWAASRWPGGDHRVYTYQGGRDNAGMCAAGDVCTFNYHSPRANRDGPVAVVLPPGYHRPENASETYPVVYFLHGYGMDPDGFASVGLLIARSMGQGSFAEWQRPGKFILVFPDGRCRDGDGCPRGTFYVDSPNPGNARMETYFLDLYDHISASYRARPASDVEIVE
ncbi:MAG: hypothetical protein WCJ30_00740 [Deltaproteobacteria bacterium]